MTSYTTETDDGYSTVWQAQKGNCYEQAEGKAACV